MNFMDSVKTCLSKYVEISGRATRSEYWWFQLFIFGTIFVLAFIAQASQGGSLGQAAQIVAGLFYLAIIIPALTVTIRRLHDIDKSGWFILIGLIPLVGVLILLYWYCLPGTQGQNRFGN